MSSEEIKESLDEWLSDYSVENVEELFGKWKLLSKKRDSQGRENRIFFNTKSNKKVLVVDEDIKGWLSEGDYAFYIYTREDDNFTNIFKCYVVITSLSYFKEDKATSDWHLSELLNLPDYLEEVCEAEFGSEKSIEDTKADLLTYGVVEDKDFTTFMKKHR